MADVGWRHARTGVLLGMAALVLATEGASGEEVLRPVETVRACPRQGPGYVALAGSTTCLRIGGRTAAEYGSAAHGSRRHLVERRGGGTSARISADIRTETPYGPVRGFVRLRAAGGGRAD